jgi:hypothetical protein
MSAWNIAPALPPLALMVGARHVLWAIALVWLLIRLRLGASHLLGARGPRAAWLGAAGLLAVWTLWPGPASPAYWLGLAFQSPSLVTGALCAWQIRSWLVQLPLPVSASASGPGPGLARRPARQAGWTVLVGLGVLLGWLLLLDTLALIAPLLPGSVYAWGFSPAALWLLLAAAAALWLARQTGPAGLLLAVATAFAASHLPTGNLWDALLDPWLWAALHLMLARQVIRALRRTP